nr:MAG TPA: hypothetical protein [Caudoviricetes sp.]
MAARIYYRLTRRYLNGKEQIRAWVKNLWRAILT